MSNKKLDVKIVPAGTRLWTAVRDEAKQLIKSHKDSLIVQEAVYEMAESKLKQLKK